MFDFSQLPVALQNALDVPFRQLVALRCRSSQFIHKKQEIFNRELGSSSKRLRKVGSIAVGATSKQRTSAGAKRQQLWVEYNGFRATEPSFRDPDAGPAPQAIQDLALLLHSTLQPPTKVLIGFGKALDHLRLIRFARGYIWHLHASRTEPLEHLCERGFRRYGSLHS